MSEYYSKAELDEMSPGRYLTDVEGDEATKMDNGRWTYSPESASPGLDSERMAYMFPREGADADAPSILTEAQDTISTSRQADYGDAQVSFTRIADLWSTYLGQTVSAQDVACLMALMKISRIKGDPSKRDSWVDLAGYAGLGGELG